MIRKYVKGTLTEKVHLAGKEPRGVHEYYPVIHASGYVAPDTTDEELQVRAEKLLARGAKTVALFIKPNGSRTIAGIWYHKRRNYGDVEDF
ncbi:hypothetical protein ABEU97_20485 [Priestia megaterium]